MSLASEKSAKKIFVSWFYATFSCAGRPPPECFRIPWNCRGFDWVSPDCGFSDNSFWFFHCPFLSSSDSLMIPLSYLFHIPWPFSNRLETCLQFVCLVCLDLSKVQWLLLDRFFYEFQLLRLNWCCFWHDFLLNKHDFLLFLFFDSGAFISCFIDSNFLSK